MLEQIKQVGLTYATQRYLWWGIGLLSITGLPNFFILVAGERRGSGNGASAILFALAMPTFILLPFLVGQIKMQFGHSRARLMPHFFPAHLIVLSGILLTGLFLYPWSLAVFSGIEPLGVIALVLAMGAPALWGAQLNRFSAMLVSLLVFYSLLTDWGNHWWIVDAASHRGGLALIIAAGTVLVIAWLLRLTSLTEEMPDYQNVYAAMLARRTGSEAVEQRRIVASQVGRNQLMTRVGDWWFDRIGSYYGGSKAGLVRILRYGYAPNPIEIQGLFMALMIISIGLFFTKASILARSGSNLSGMIMFIQFSYLVPAQAAGELLAQRRPRMAWEMLLPLSRVQLIDGLLTAAARNAFTLWFMMNAALAVVVCLQDTPVPVGTFCMFLLMSASAMFATMGLSLRIAIWPSMAKRMAAIIPSCVVLLIPIALWWNLHERFGDWPFAIVAIGIVAIGIALLREARRAWLALEMV